MYLKFWFKIFWIEFLSTFHSDYFALFRKRSKKICFPMIDLRSFVRNQELINTSAM